MTVREIADTVLSNLGEDIQQQGTDEYFRSIVTDINDAMRDIEPLLRPDAPIKPVQKREETPGIPERYHYLLALYSTAQMLYREWKLDVAAAFEAKYQAGRALIDADNYAAGKNRFKNAFR